MADEDEFAEFLSESRDNLDLFENAMLALEREPGNERHVRDAFRSMHSIKGTSGFFDVGGLTGVAHAAENVLSLLRDEELECDALVTTALLRVADSLRAMFDLVVRGEPPAGDPALVAALEVIARGGRPALPERSGDRAHDPPPVADAAPNEPPFADALTRTVEAVVAPGDGGGVAAARADAPTHEPRRDVSLLPPAPGALASPTHAPPADAGGPAESRSVRIDVTLLDRLMDLAGEIVLARNQILRHAASTSDPGFLSTAHSLNALTTELQERVMKTRMQPVRGLFAKLPRLVRDVSSRCGKSIRLELSGEETELDRTILDGIKDPLTHLVRNAIDHGAETPAERAEAGKAPQVTVAIRASHDSGYVRIVVSDDGRGIDPLRVGRKAIERRLLSQAELERTAPGDLLKLIFLPGFSTASTVSEISGRGVGMDVVKTMVEQLGGTVDLESEAGRGTAIILSIPLTLAIMPALIVSTGGDRYAIPQTSVHEIVRIIPQRGDRLEWVGDAPVYRLRGQLLPLVFLDRQLELDSPTVPGAAGPINIAVVQVQGRRFGIVVDRIEDAAEIVVKPLARQVQAASIFGGATILSDGTVALILDLVDMARRTRAGLEEVARHAASEQQAAGPTNTVPTTTMLVFAIGRRLLATELGEVKRIEKLHASAIETTGRGSVVQYRGELMPVMPLGDLLEAPHDTEGEFVHLLVCDRGDKPVGLLVDRVVDVVVGAFEVKRRAARHGLRGTAVVQGRATDVVDLPALLSRIAPSIRPPAGDALDGA